MATILAGAPGGSLPRLGLDLYSLRSQAWSAFDYLDFCHAHGVEVAQFSMPSSLGGLDEANLRAVRLHADSIGVAIEIGMGSICESSTSFRRDDGSAVEQLARMLDVAKTVGSTIVRCFLGSSEDRAGRQVGVPLAPQSSIPLREHIANTISTCRGVERRARKLGVKIAIENHVGDLHSSELRTLIEAAGPDFVGAVIDTGNATWALETPLAALHNLAPYVLASHVRDSAVWAVQDGLAVRWCPLGRGNVAIVDFTAEFADACPGAAFTLETINPPGPRTFLWRMPGFWDAYRTIPAWTFAELVEIAALGQPFVDEGPIVGSSAERERADVVEALAYATGVMGLGRR